MSKQEIKLLIKEAWRHWDLYQKTGQYVKAERLRTKIALLKQKIR